MTNQATLVDFDQIQLDTVIAGLPCANPEENCPGGGVRQYVGRNHGDALVYCTACGSTYAATVFDDSFQRRRLNRLQITVTAPNGHVVYRTNTRARKGANDCETVWTFLGACGVLPAMGDRVRWERVE
jgi:hypothetical protein